MVHSVLWARCSVGGLSTHAWKTKRAECVAAHGGLIDRGYEDILAPVSLI
jgi:hypothetical protein